jgi:hypothetical protein
MSTHKNKNQVIFYPSRLLWMTGIIGILLYATVMILGAPTRYLLSAEMLKLVVGVLAVLGTAIASLHILWKHRITSLLHALFAGFFILWSHAIGLASLPLLINCDLTSIGVCDAVGGIALTFLTIPWLLIIVPASLLVGIIFELYNRSRIKK